MTYLKRKFKSFIDWSGLPAPFWYRTAAFVASVIPLMLSIRNDFTGILFGLFFGILFDYVWVEGDRFPMSKSDPPKDAT